MRHTLYQALICSLQRYRKELIDVKQFWSVWNGCVKSVISDEAWKAQWISHLPLGNRSLTRTPLFGTPRLTLHSGIFKLFQHSRAGSVNRRPVVSVSTRCARWQGLKRLSSCHWSWTSLVSEKSKFPRILLIYLFEAFTIPLPLFPRIIEWYTKVIWIIGPRAIL